MILSTIHHASSVDLGGLVVCLIVALIVGALAYAIASVVPPLARFAALIGLCIGALAFLACWF